MGLAEEGVFFSNREREREKERKKEEKRRKKKKEKKRKRARKRTRREALTGFLLCRVSHCNQLLPDVEGRVINTQHLWYRAKVFTSSPRREEIDAWFGSYNRRCEMWCVQPSFLKAKLDGGSALAENHWTHVFQYFFEKTPKIQGAFQQIQVPPLNSKNWHQVKFFCISGFRIYWAGRITWQGLRSGFENTSNKVQFRFEHTRDQLVWRTAPDLK